MAKRDVKYCVLDTNVFVYGIDKSGDRYAEVCRFLDSMGKAGYRFCVTEQIVREVLVVATQGRFVSRPLNSAEAKRLATALLYKFVFLPANNFSRLYLLDLIEKHKLSGNKIHDANIVAVMCAHGVKDIVTYNRKDFSGFREIKLVH